MVLSADQSRIHQVDLAKELRRSQDRLRKEARTQCPVIWRGLLALSVISMYTFVILSLTYLYICGVSVYKYRERGVISEDSSFFHGNHAVGRICISSGLPNGFHHERKARFHALCAGAERAGDDSHRDQEPAPILERSVGRWTKPVPPVTFKWLWCVWPD